MERQYNENKIIQLYLEGKSTTTIGKELKYGEKSVKKILIKNKVALRNKTGLKKCNENYFENLDTPNKAYFLGFIYADGCILDHKHRQEQLVINLQSQDKYILDAFSKELEFEGSLHFYEGSKIAKTPYKDRFIKRGDLYRLTISSDKLCKDLRNWGVTPRKSLTCKFPHNIPNELIPHFIRGIFDGDGYISKRNNEDRFNPSFVLGVTGTENICLAINEIFAKELKISSNRKLSSKENGHVYRVFYSNVTEIKKIYPFLYPEGVGLFLIRKKNIMEEIFKFNYSEREFKARPATTNESSPEYQINYVSGP
jgi:intein-encoded DNA endonuclease-like protein